MSSCFDKKGQKKEGMSSCLESYTFVKARASGNSGLKRISNASNALVTWTSPIKHKHEIRRKTLNKYVILINIKSKAFGYGCSNLCKTQFSQTRSSTPY